MKLLKEWSGVVALVAIIVTWVLPAPSFGVVNNGNVTNYDALDVSDGYYVDGVLAINDNTMKLGGAEIKGVSQSFTSATTTPCSIANPFSATSTLIGYEMEITVGTGTAATIDVGTALTPYATTSDLLIQSSSFAANALGTVPMPGALPTTATSTVISAGEYVNVKTNGAGLGGYTYTGTCTAVFLAP